MDPLITAATAVGTGLGTGVAALIAGLKLGARRNGTGRWHPDDRALVERIVTSLDRLRTVQHQTKDEVDNLTVQIAKLVGFLEGQASRGS